MKKYILLLLIFFNFNLFSYDINDNVLSFPIDYDGSKNTDSTNQFTLTGTGSYSSSDYASGYNLTLPIAFGYRTLTINTNKSNRLYLTSDNNTYIEISYWANYTINLKSNGVTYNLLDGSPNFDNSWIHLIFEDNVIKVYKSDTFLGYFNFSINPNYFGIATIEDYTRLYSIYLYSVPLNQTNLTQLRSMGTNWYPIPPLKSTDICDDTAPPLATGLTDGPQYSCDRTCESVNYITLPDTTCTPQATITCDFLETQCTNYCGNTGVFMFSCNQDSVNGYYVGEPQINTPCTCNTAPPSDQNYTIPTSAMDIQNSENHLTTDEGDVYNTYNYEQNSTTNINLSELVDFKNKIDDLASNINDNLITSNDNLETQTNTLNNIATNTQTTNDKLDTLIDTVKNLSFSSDDNSTDTNISTTITTSNYDINDSFFTDFSETITNYTTSFNDLYDSIEILKDTISNPLSFNITKDNAVDSCLLTKYVNIGNDIEKEINFDICYHIHQYYQLFYTIFYLIFTVAFIKYSFYVVRFLI